MFDDLVKRLRLYTEDYVAYKIDADFASAVQEAADAIEALICEVADEHNARMDAEERQHWIPVTDRLPDRQDEYLVLWTHRIGRTARLFYEILEFDGENWVDDIPQAEPFGGAEVLYWMELPELPKEG